MAAETKSISIFSARACADPLYIAAELFEQQTGIKVNVSVCNRHCASQIAEEAVEGMEHADFLVEIIEDGIYDLAISGAEYLLDDGEIRGIVQKGQRRTIACRESAIVVPSDNPARIGKIEDMAKPGVRVAISMTDCLKGAWEDICGRLGMLEAIRNNFAFRANGCVALIEAIAEGKVDAAFGWAAFKHLDPDRIDVIEMPESVRISRGTGVGLLKTASDAESAVKFMDFLVTDESRAIYVKHGWVLP